MLENIRALIAAALDEREGAEAKVTAILDAVESEGRTDLTPEETQEFDAARAEVRSIDERIDALKAQEADMSELNERNEAAAEIRAELAKAEPQIAVKSEARTYRPDGEHDFLRDAFAAKEGSRNAAERLERNRSEVLAEYRSTTGNFGSLVVPTYMTELFAPALKSGRPYLSAVSNVALPAEGMSIYIPRATAGTSVAAQATENTAVSNTTETTDTLTVPVRTFAGQQVLSRQAVERGAGIAEILLADLAAEYATKVNVSAIAGDGTAGAHWGVLNTTSVQTAAWTGTTGASLVSSLHNAIGKVNGSRYLAPDTIVMHPRRWAWLCAQSDSSNRPLVQVDGPGFNSVGTGAAAGYGVVGSVAGIRVITDAGVPINLGASTDEDRVLVFNSRDHIFMEDGGAPIGLRIEEVLADQLSVRLVAYGFSAFSGGGRYPVGTCVLQGTGFKQVLS